MQALNASNAVGSCPDPTLVETINAEEISP